MLSLYFYRSRLRIGILFGVLVLIGLRVPGLEAQSPTASFKSPEGLSLSARSFLQAWVVRRDVPKAMQFVTAKPVLARECNLPDGIHQVPRSSVRRRKIIELTLLTGLKVFPKYESLDSAVKPTEIPVSYWFDANDDALFQVLRIRPGHEGYLMCKFEQNKGYRKTLLRPDVYYVSFRLTNMDDSPYYEQWISLWAKEHRRWRLLSLALLDD
jgi:hypothetical protein